ncbi:DUF938 domain-containing protein [Marinimicrobium sp. C2-29]|uniref:DUF938 domain-containing protein n=1 Tax=Marinimicrobium sp. C2-29 TaxID=3139825 RepID=UPI003139F085
MSLEHKPFSQACENNKQPILSVLEPRLKDAKQVLELGSGTGQHAVFFARHLPHLIWQTSDLPENHPGIHQWLADSSLDNIRPPLILDVDQPDWPLSEADAIFTANTFHIIAWDQVLKLLDGSARLLPPDGLLIVYGPFNEEGRFTSESNARFDQMLRDNTPHRGIRNRQTVAEEARTRGLLLEETLELPANNRCLVFRRST